MREARRELGEPSVAAWRTERAPTPSRSPCGRPIRSPRVPSGPR